ncbi:MAG: hypothetical protein NUW22_05000 [Acidobacteria bacterium]|nr:hypothetical protein [Acidobacteriota bacterium]
MLTKPVPLTREQRQAKRAARKNARVDAKFGRVKVRDNASNCAELALSKGVTSDEQIAAEHTAEVKQIRLTRAKVFRRSQFCECCGDSEQETSQKSPKAAHEMHETTPRSLTRGLPPAERFNVRICMRACAICHPLLQRRVLRIDFHNDERRMTGDYDVIDGATGHIIRHMRRGVDRRIALLSTEKYRYISEQRGA